MKCERKVSFVSTMKIIFAFGVIGITPAAAQEYSSEECLAMAVTQGDLTGCAIADMNKVEVQMNSLYENVLSEFREDDEAAQKIRAAQEAWLVFREAYIEAIFPKSENPDDARREYGSVFPMCWASINAELTRWRNDQLRQWTEGIEDGDVCVGSRAFKSD